MWEQVALSALVILGCGYNGLLAIVNAHAFHLSGSAAVLAEVLILASAMLVILPRLSMADLVPLGFLYVSLTLGVIISLVNGAFYPDGIRNMAIVGVFTLLGTRATNRTATTTITILCAIVFVVLLLEIVSLDSYVTVFRPADYLESTRGFRNSEFNESGLFNNALGFEGRFSFGLLNVPRTSSIFIEQVSLSTFASVVALVLMGGADLFRRWQRILLIALPVLIAISNNGRASSSLCAIFLVGFFVFPLLPRWTNLLVLPTILAAGLAIYPFADERTDDLVFRVHWALKNIFDMTIGQYFGTDVGLAWRYYDSGYAFLINSTTMFGAIMLIAYTLTRVPGVGRRGRRVALALPIYLFASLLVSGSSIFSIKTAALVWFFAGWMHRVVWEERAGTMPVEAVR